MSWKLYDFLDNRNRNTIKNWLQELERAEQAKLNQKLDMLEKHGSNLPTGLLSDTKFPHIKKIRIKGQVAPRLMLCRGPIENDKEYTLLYGAIEKDRKLIPRDADARAEARRQEIIEAQPSSQGNIVLPNPRRCLHERVEE